MSRPDRSPTHVHVPTGASPSVAVVGAGIAGVRVAAGLSRSGVATTVFEARGRVGGRLLSPGLPDGAGRVDLGATWFWPGEARVARLVAELGIETHPQHLEGDALYQDTTGCRRLSGNPIDVPSLRFSGGAQALADRLAATLAPGVIRLGCPVSAIVGSGPFTVVHDDGVTEADHVVLALPPALAVRNVEFDPPLPGPLAELAAVTPVWMGGTTKVVAHYAHPFWRDAGLAGAAISHVGPMREIHDMSGPDGSPAALFGFVPNAPGAAAPSEQAIAAQLVDLFGPQAADPLALIVTDWRTEEHTSPPGVESLGAYQAFGHSVYQRSAPDRPLFWASTETAASFAGHIEGALAAADRTVDALLAHPSDRQATQPR